MAFHSIHLPHPIPPLDGPFDIVCPPKTDIWDKPPNTHQFNAPLIYRITTVAAFVSASLSVSAVWGERYDQGGLGLVIKSADGTTRWIKIGVELENGAPQAGIVVKDAWADWSLQPLPFGATDTLRVEAAVEGGDLWIYALSADGKARTPMRQVTWWSALPADAELWVGPFAAKPAPTGGTDDLVVHFDKLSVQTK